APKMASRLESGLMSDAVYVEVDGDKEGFTRPSYSGKAFEKKTIKDGLVFVTIRPNNIPMLEKDEGGSGEVTAKDIDIKDLRTVIQEIIRKKSEGIDMSEGSIVVAGGRGVKSKEGLDTLNELEVVLWEALVAARG